MGTIHILGNDRLPLVIEEADQFVLDVIVIERDRAGHDQEVFAVAIPEALDRQRQQAQHAPGSLEAIEGAPVVVEALEQLRVDRVGADQQIAVARFAGFGRELGGVLGIEVGEAAHHRIAGSAGRLGGDRLEQPPPHNLETLVAGGRPPLVGDAGDHVLE